MSHDSLGQSGYGHPQVYKILHVRSVQGLKRTQG